MGANGKAPRQRQPAQRVPRAWSSSHPGTTTQPPQTAPTGRYTLLLPCSVPSAIHHENTTASRAVAFGMSASDCTSWQEELLFMGLEHSAPILVALWIGQSSPACQGTENTLCQEVTTSQTPAHWPSHQQQPTNQRQLVPIFHRALVAPRREIPIYNFHLEQRRMLFTALETVSFWLQQAFNTTSKNEGQPGCYLAQLVPGESKEMPMPP